MFSVYFILLTGELHAPAKSNYLSSFLNFYFIKVWLIYSVVLICLSS